jgi:hypothetical protein
LGRLWKRLAPGLDFFLHLFGLLLFNHPECQVVKQRGSLGSKLVWIEEWDSETNKQLFSYFSSNTYNFNKIKNFEYKIKLWWSFSKSQHLISPAVKAEIACIV